MEFQNKQDASSSRTATHEAAKKEELRRQLLEVIKRNEALRQAKPR
jgi:hypothetical protein